ncbi:MAG: DEAD/DEAH box helicase family protein [Rhizobiales bacterium]|nr:DEAD/DEAH box helicase family protein [Hyphomicrobiales bacterium]MDQ3559044.1 SNF2-related protein [Pseudomonadota bacterium]
MADTPYESDIWSDRLLTAFADANLDSGFLPLAENAIEARPGDPVILMLAAMAALLDERPERALVFLKRFSRRASAPAEHLLRALALHQLNKPVAARALLERNGLAGRRAALQAFPGGPKRLPWLMRQLEGILGPVSFPGRPRPAARAKIKPRTASRDETTGRPRKAPADVAPAPPPLPRVDIEVPFTIEFDAASLLSALPREMEQDGRWFGLRERFAHFGLAQGFDELLCLPHLAGVEPLSHQIETVRKVLKQFRGRVLLADEVGLGKTIEAGMVLKEYALRGMAERTLILTPASLVGQWREELETKFGLAFATTHDALLRDRPQAFWAQDRIVASIATARRRDHAERLVERRFDLIIIDEAHHLRDRSSQSWKLVDQLNKRFLLLLSATPVQNDLIELYNLLTLLKPGIFKTPKEFRLAYMTPGKPRQPANSDRLRALMRDAMIRNTRAVVALKLPRRHAATIKVDAGRGESEAYAALGAAARRLATEGEGKRERLALHHLLSAAGSSPRAAAGALARVAARNADDPIWAELASRWAAIEAGGKEAALIDLVRRNPTEKKLVFVHSRATLAHLADRLKEAGVSLARFDGSLSGQEKDAAIAAFRDHASVLLCTQSGGEGRNIQFCNTLINFDVPWNPMAIEQRIGRIDRIGQSREVFVFNLVTRGTLEEQLLALLDEKISMFELVVGEVGAILGGLEEEREFPDLVLDAWLGATEASRLQAFEALGQRLEQARRQHDHAKALDEKLFGEDFEAA